MTPAFFKVQHANVQVHLGEEDILKQLFWRGSAGNDQGPSPKVTYWKQIQPAEINPPGNEGMMAFMSGEIKLEELTLIVMR